MTMEKILRGAVLSLLILCVAQVNGVPKYGGTCQDISCNDSTKVCVLAEDSCNEYPSDKCGIYPICVTNVWNCSTIECPAGYYCKTNVDQPTCIKAKLHPASPGPSPAGGRRRRAYATPVPTRPHNYEPVTVAPVEPTPPRPRRTRPIVVRLPSIPEAVNENYYH